LINNEASIFKKIYCHRFLLTPNDKYLLQACANQAQHTGENFLFIETSISLCFLLSQALDGCLFL
jgi:hypothetical protein